MPSEATVELPRISVSVKAAIVDKGHVLLLSYNDHAGFHYNLPGGKAREGEPLRDAVVRKVLTETGLHVETDRLLFVVEYIPERWNGEFGPVHKTQYNFKARISGPSTEPGMSDPPDPDQVGFEWVPVADLLHVPLLPRVGEHLRATLTSHSPTPPDLLVDRW